ncbi:hypothetical protein X559_1395 [Paenilisteria newyorkensis]|nr:hypothetical protein X559_1395 [Listeria newyorkensis]
MGNLALNEEPEFRLTQIERKRLYSGSFVEAGSGAYDCM